MVAVAATAVHGEGTVCIVALEDLLEVFVEPGPTSGEVMEGQSTGAR